MNTFIFIIISPARVISPISPIWVFLFIHIIDLFYYLTSWRLSKYLLFLQTPETLLNTVSNKSNLSGFVIFVITIKKYNWCPVRRLLLSNIRKQTVCGLLQLQMKVRLTRYESFVFIPFIPIVKSINFICKVSKRYHLKDTQNIWNREEKILTI